MPSPSANPTPITPPRVPLIDPRTGLIDRAWYLFFLSLNNAATAIIDDSGLTFSAESTIASVDAELRTLAQFAETLPPSIDLNSELIKQIDAAALADCCSALVSQVAELQKQIEALQVTPPPREFKRARYGQFYDTTTQIPAAINTPYAITFNTTDVTNGVYLGTPTSRVYVDEPAIYNFIFSIQLDKTSGGTGIFWVWPRINGVNVPDSNSQVRLQGNNAEQLVTAGYFFDLNAGDYVEIMYAVSDISVQVEAFPASAFYPAIPSIILTVSNNIEGVQ